MEGGGEGDGWGVWKVNPRCCFADRGEQADFTACGCDCFVSVKDGSAGADVATDFSDVLVGLHLVCEDFDGFFFRAVIRHASERGVLDHYYCIGAGWEGGASGDSCDLPVLEGWGFSRCCMGDVGDGKDAFGARTVWGDDDCIAIDYACAVRGDCFTGYDVFGEDVAD